MQTPIDVEIDELPMHEMTGEEAVNKLDPNSLEARLKRKKVRYTLYRLRGQAEGRELPEGLDLSVVTALMVQKGFDGWVNFAQTWYVALHDPLVLISRNHSEVEDWERVVSAKFPQIQPDGSVKYPDMDVKKAVDIEAKNQAKLKGSK